MVDAERLREKILKVLSQSIFRPANITKQQPKCCQGFSSHGTKTTKDDLSLDKVGKHDLNALDRESSIPPQDCNQVNKNESLHRPFNNKPTSNGTPVAMKVKDNANENFAGKPSGILSPKQQHFKEGNGLVGNVQQKNSISASNITGINSKNNDHRTVLIETLVNNHNDDAEKLILNEHKETNNIERKADKMIFPGKFSQENVAPMEGHGIKRSGSNFLEGEMYKNSKQRHIYENRTHTAVPTEGIYSKNAEVCATSTELGIQHTNRNDIKNINLWPPFSVSFSNNHSPHTSAVNYFSSTNRIVPALYYIPLPQPAANQTNRSANAPYALQYLTGLMYPYPSLFSQAVVYPQRSVAYQPIPFSAIPVPVGTTLTDQLNVFF